MATSVDHDDKAVIEKPNMKVLFDFTKIHHLNDWIEVSDPVREVGKSKASFVIQKTQLFQRAIFFTLLNPQPNGAGFAGININTQLDLSNYTNIVLHLRAQGENYKYKVNLRHKGLNHEPHPTYEQVFDAPKEFADVVLPLSNFEPYYRGRKQDPKEVGYLDTSNITNFEFQIFGGVYSPFKQSGVSALEIDTVTVV